MRERTSEASVTDDAEAPESPVTCADGAPRSDVAAEPAFVTGSHTLLFADDAVPRCDICGVEVESDDDEGPKLAGSALYVSVRGDVVRYDEPPLCHTCAAAVGVTALQRWDLEEEEG